MSVALMTDSAPSKKSGFDAEFDLAVTNEDDIDMAPAELCAISIICGLSCGSST